MMRAWGAFGGWFWVILIWMLRWVFLAVLVAGVVWLITGYRRSTAAESDAMAILKRRLAAGEISESEYNRLKDLLNQR